VILFLEALIEMSRSGGIYFYIEKYKWINLLIPLMDMAILAGGKGTRMSALSDKPKCVLDLQGKPILVHLIEHFKQFGFQRFVMVVGHRADEVKTELSKHTLTDALTDVEIVFTKPANKGTAAALQELKNYFDNDFMLVNGDILTDFDPTKIIQLHQDSNALLTTAVKDEAVEIPYGILEMKNNQYLDFLETKSISYLRHVGVFVFSKGIFSYLEKTAREDSGEKITGKRIEYFIKDLMAKNKAQFFNYDQQLLWLNINTPEELEKASKIMAEINAGKGRT